MPNPAAAQLAAMVSQGAVITTAAFLRYVPYVAEILEAGQRRGLFWIATGAENQEDAHVLLFTRLELQHAERDLCLMDAAGTPVAWVTPALDTPELSTDDIREALAAYRAELAEPGAMECFQDFAATMRADALRTVEAA